MKNLNQLFHKATQYHQQGALDKAKQLYLKLHRSNPTHPELNHLLGCVFYQKNQSQQSIKYFSQAIQLDNNNPDYWNNRGLAYLSAQQGERARDDFFTAIKLSPKHVNAYHNLGLSHKASTDYQKALKYYHQALGLDAYHIPSLVAAAEVYRLMGETQQSLDMLKKVHDIDANNMQLHEQLALVYFSQDEFALAKMHYEKVIRHFPENVDMQYQYADILYKYGLKVQSTAVLQEARHLLEKALKRKPDLDEARICLVGLLRDLYQFDAAIAHLRKLEQTSFDEAKVKNEFGLIYQAEGDNDKARSYFHQSVECDGNYQAAQFNLGYSYLLAGELVKGWQYTKARWHNQFVGNKLNFELPEWQGESLENKTILIWGEQGIGDEVMFSRFALPLMNRFSSLRVYLLCDDRLSPLFRRSYPEVSIIDKSNASELPLAEIDCHISLGDLVEFFLPLENTQAPYLVASADQVQKLQEHYKKQYPNKKIIGFSWRSGNPQNGVHRSMPLEYWRDLFSFSDIQWVNIQYGKEDAKTFAAMKEQYHNLSSAKTDVFSEIDSFAAELMAFDMILSIDNSTVHLAGALGVPVWLMLPYAGDWRWLAAGQESYWYRETKLYRQQSVGDWASVVKDVIKHLHSM